MIKLVIFLFLLLPLLSSNGPVLTLPITISPKQYLLTSYTLGNSQVPAQISINSNQLSVCCQIRQSVFESIYYFMLKPFNQNQNFICKPKTIVTHQVAVFPKLGPLNVNINQTVFPTCQQGILGLGKNSYFLSLLPKTSQTFEIKNSNKRSNGLRYQLIVGGTTNSQFTMFPPVHSNLWMLTISNIIFNSISIGAQNVTFSSEKYQLGIPKTQYNLIRSQFISHFLCIEQNSKIFCPCTTGISSSYPSFYLVASNTSFVIKPTAYLIEHDQVCEVTIVGIIKPYWQIHVAMFEDVNLLFNFGTGSVGMAHGSKTLQTSNSITQPLQIILNSVVILLMCLFVAMILIEVIKHISGLENASNESFENYMMKRAED